MNANKVTVAMLKAAGFHVATGDVRTSWVINHGDVVIDFNMSFDCNCGRASKGVLNSKIVSLALRENTGTQPVADDCVVEVTQRNKVVRTCRASDVTWSNVKAYPTWMPHLPSISEKQMNIDKSALELTERDIEDAFIQQEDASVERELSESYDWVNGDVCSIEGYNGEWQFGCDVPNSLLAMVFRIESSAHMTIPKCRLIKPLTPEQLAAKEREDAIDGMYAIFMSDLSVTARDGIAAIYDVGYRK